MTPRSGFSLRTRLITGAGVIATVAIFGALLAVFGTGEISRRIETAIMAQHRMETLSLLSARVNDYGMVAAEVTRIGSRTPQERLSILQSRSDIVDSVFDRLNKAIEASVQAAASDGEVEQVRRATQGLSVARMRAQFNQLKRTLTQHDGIDPSRIRTSLDGFATQFSPLLDQAIAQERRDRDAAFASADAFQHKLLWAAGSVALMALLSLFIFQFGLVRPLIHRIGKITKTAQEIGGGAFDQRIDINQRDELGLLFANVNRMAARLGRQRQAVDSDRNQFNAIIDERTEALKIANFKLEQLDSKRRRFFADVSHELRTPLTVILGEADLGMRSPDFDEEQARASMALIHTRAGRLNRRIDDLLRVARSESGEIDLENIDFDIYAATQDAVADLEVLAKRRNILISIGSNGSYKATGDRDWTRQIISGLLDNAIRHSQEHSVIEITFTAVQKTVEISIEDDGDGIAPCEQNAIFERFTRGIDTTKRTGFGVGLSLAKWVIERQGGSILLLSPCKNGAGTRVTLSMQHSPGENINGAEARSDR